MKKITALALTSAMVLSLAACGGSSSDTKTSDDSKKASKSDVEYVQDKGTLVVGITDFEPMVTKMIRMNGLVLMPTWQKHLQKALA